MLNSSQPFSGFDTGLCGFFSERFRVIHRLGALPSSVKYVLIECYVFFLPCSYLICFIFFDPPVCEITKERV
jgi:hypothetical protein